MPEDLDVLASYFDDRGYEVRLVYSDMYVNDILQSTTQLRGFKILAKSGSVWVEHANNGDWYVGFWPSTNVNIVEVPTPHDIEIDPALPDAIERLEQAVNKWQKL